jgi:hypothetical protein
MIHSNRNLGESTFLRQHVNSHSIASQPFQHGGPGDDAFSIHRFLRALKGGGIKGGEGEIDKLVQRQLDGSGAADILTDQVCMEQAAGFGLGCTANDVSLASAINIVIEDDGCAFPGDTVTFTADFEVVLTAQARHDIGIWFAEDGDPNEDGALTGACTVATPAYAQDPPYLDLDGTNDPFPGDNTASGIQDTCGDIDNDHNPLFPTITLTVTCIPDNSDPPKLRLP